LENPRLGLFLHKTKAAAKKPLHYHPKRDSTKKVRRLLAVGLRESPAKQATKNLQQASANMRQNLIRIVHALVGTGNPALGTRSRQKERGGHWDDCSGFRGAYSFFALLDFAVGLCQ